MVFKLYGSAMSFAMSFALASLAKRIRRGVGAVALSVLVWSIGLGLLGDTLVGRCAFGQSQDVAAKIDKNWDEVFTTRQGWTGGDGAGTVDLGNGRVLWMFADSFIGGVAEGKHSPGSHMIHNVFSVQTVKDRSKPQLAEFEFSWGPAGPDGKPTAWVKPDPEIMSKAREIDDLLSPNGWFWPAGGGCLVDVGGKQQLFVFLFHIGSNGKPGVWGFENIGGAMLVIDNPDRPISEWKIRQIDFPFTKDALRESGKSDGPIPLMETNWGLACMVEKAPTDSLATGWIYIYGDQHLQYKDRQLILARVRPEEIEDFDQWSFYAGPRGWVNDVEQVAAIASEIGAEFSIEKIEFQGKTKYVMVHSHPMLGTEIFIRTANAPEGPWSNGIAVYDVPDVKKSKNYFTYAARGHGVLSTDGELLITYIVNSNDFWEMAGDASIYRPRCITVPLAPFFGYERGEVK